MTTNAQLVSFLKKQHVQAGFIDKLKIIYRPFICPFNELISLVETDDLILDIGCGSGQFCALLAEFTKPRAIYGIEIDQQLVDHAEELLSAYPSLYHSFNTFNGIDFPDHLGNADIVFLVDVIHHVPTKNQRLFLSNLCKELKPGARLVIKDINGSSPWVLFNKLHDAVFAHEIGHELSVKKISSILTNNGLTIASQTQKRMYVYPHYTIIAKK